MTCNPVSHVTSCDSQRFAGDPAAFEVEITIPSDSGPARFGGVMAVAAAPGSGEISPVDYQANSPIIQAFWPVREGHGVKAALTAPDCSQLGAVFIG
ncbi:MAG TPA: hypothetical protein VG125_20265 [Pirellulales bacterium]|jgi:hypothetical protein|nr:hypothetical protein [Pirellulales bacterium]